MEKKVKQCGGVIFFNSNQRGGITAEDATDIMIKDGKSVLDSVAAAEKDPNTNPAYVAKLREILNNLKGR